MSDHLHISTSGEEGIYTLTLDVKDQKHNVLSTPVMTELESCLSGLEQEEGIRALIIRSAKAGSFIAGADIGEIQGLDSPSEATAKARRGQEIMNRIEDLPFPTLAAIDGPCLGGGLELALSCSARIVSDNPKTKLGLPEVTLGVLPGFGGTYRLPRLIGIPESLGIILPGKTVDGRKAAKIALADKVVAAPFLDQEAMNMARSLAAGASPQRRVRGGILNRPLIRGLAYRQAKNTILKKSGTDYPAPLRALETVKRGMRRSRTAALALESSEFGKLAAGRIAKNLTGLFFASEALKKQPALKAGPSKRYGAPSGLRQAAVIGAGVMGGKIAWLFSKYDIPVVMKDIAWDAVTKGLAAASGVYATLVKRRRFTKREAEHKQARISGTVAYEDMGRPGFAVEAVVENMDIKRKVLAELEEKVAPETIIATNTSALSVSEMAKGLNKPQRFVGMHFFNPPERMPLVEVIAGKDSDPEAVNYTAQLAARLGKTPVVVKDRPGFLVNRLLMPYLSEAVMLFSEGAPVERMDRLLKEFGMPMGPFRLLDEIGIDVGYKVAHILHEAFGDRMPLKAAFGKMVNQGKLLGRKNGKGFYLYPSRKPNPALKTYRDSSGNSSFTDQDLRMRPLILMINEAAYALEEEVVASPTELDMAMIMGTGFPAFRGGLLRYADSIGSSTIVDLLDRYADSHGTRFVAAPLLRQMAQTEALFYGEV